MIRNLCNIFWVDAGIHTKNGGKTYASCALSFDSLQGNQTSVEINLNFSA